ncbi:MAG: hypothetical protein KUG79_19355 [Pseudomonadales bacterium]|nr:hypothetical protein [Pseudomonadales bacterium]
MRAYNKKLEYFGASADASDSILEIEYLPAFPNGQPALNQMLQEDIAAFLQSLANTQKLIIGLFVLLSVVGVCSALVLLQKFI